ncbi:MAG TPA: N-acetylmuramoyl-L-alanine amidase [Bacteroidales bacterium]|nr:N-acetylmuramoyl-L-alanine amidase [Bacteroidales bacterium]
MKKILLFLLLLAVFRLTAQTQESTYPYQSYFNEAYQHYPDVPRGVLEAVSYTYTHIRHVDPPAEESSCSGLPGFYGVMGLVLDGKGYFRENLKKVAGLSGYNTDQIISDPRVNILAYAAAYQKQLSYQKGKNEPALAISKVLIALSELNISNSSPANDYTINLYLYGIFYFLNDKANQQQYGFPEYSFNMRDIFGEENLKILTSKQVNVSEEAVTNENGQTYKALYLSGPCPDYNRPWCTWVASPNHYYGWNGHTISAIAIHTVQGSYVSCINWFLNPIASAATHYVVASNSSYAGQVTQMVNEYNAGWHVGSENWYSIGYEHEGYVSDPSWYTETMYQVSAALTRDICNRYNIDTRRTFFTETLDDGTVLDYGLHSLGGEGTCIKIKGHQHYPNSTHTDPGPNWDWDHYYKLLNYPTPVTTYTTPTGVFYDTGGGSGNYSVDERKFWLIQPTGAQSITLTFSQFSVEANYDYLYIYNGTNEFAPLIGRYNTISPTTITSTGGALFIEFRSDCSVTYPGWTATWTSTQSDTQDPVTTIAAVPHWVNNDFTVSFSDTDLSGGSGSGGSGNTGNSASGISGVKKKYYQVMDYNGTEWRANKQNGFFNDNFSAAVHPDWTVNTNGGTWAINNASLYQSDSTLGNSNIYTSLNQYDSSGYMYQWSAKISGSTSNRCCGLYFFADDPVLPNRGNAYFARFCADDDKVQIYRISGDTLYKKVDNPYVLNQGLWYDFKITYDPGYGEIKAYINDVPVAGWIDPKPLLNGDYVSLSSSSCKVWFDDFKVRRSRTSEITARVGNMASKDARYQSSSAAQWACRINTIVCDAAGNWSPQAAASVKVDWTAPATSVTNIPSTITGDFTATFNDTDLLSGIEKSFYQVKDMNNGKWGANAARGFISENFTVLDTNIWKIPTNSGTWISNGSSVQQTDENVNNSNIYTAIDQNLSDSYLYQFRAKVEGSSLNRRFGIYYFSDSACLPDRGNAYFIWFNVDLKTLEFFKIANDIFGTPKKTIHNVSFNSGQWYDIKVIFNHSTGKSEVLRNDTLVGSWTDPTPYNEGNYISFRSCNSKLIIDEVNVFRSRANTAIITAGPDPAKDIRYENPYPSVNAGELNTVVVDSASNISAVGHYALTINFTVPVPQQINYRQVSLLSATGIKDIHSETYNFAVSPNPLLSEAVISFELQSDENIRMILFDNSGRQVYVLADGRLSAGEHKLVINVNNSNLTKGVYYLNFTGEHNSFISKIIVL